MVTDSALDTIGRSLTKLADPTDTGKARIMDAVARRDWSTAHGWASSSWRFDLFVLLAPHMTPDERRGCLVEIWSACDFCIWPNRKVALIYFKEAKYVGDLPRPDAPLTLYRGVRRRAHRLGLSWSRKIDTARFFVHGRGPNLGGFVYSAVADPDAILGGFSDRNEAEYIVDPGSAPRRPACRNSRAGRAWGIGHVAFVSLLQAPALLRTVAIR